MTIRVQMCVLELGRIFQPISEHAVKSDVGDPDEGKGQHRVVKGRERVTGECKRTNLRVDGVIGNRPDASVGEVAQH